MVYVSAIQVLRNVISYFCPFLPVTTCHGASHARASRNIFSSNSSGVPTTHEIKSTEEYFTKITIDKIPKCHIKDYRGTSLHPQFFRQGS